MSKKDEALKLALAALEYILPDTPDQCMKKDAAITAIREALAEKTAQQQEPVSNNKFTRAWLRLDELPGTMMRGPEGLFGPIPGSTSTWVTTSERERDHQISNGNPMLEVYTSPQPSKPLTDERHYKQVIDGVREVFDAKRKQQPAQQPYDTHATPGQSFDTHSRNPPASKPSVELTDEVLQKLWPKVWPEQGAFVRASADDLRQFAHGIKE